MLADRDQIVARLPELEARAVEATELEARLSQSEQEVVTTDVSLRSVRSERRSEERRVGKSVRYRFELGGRRSLKKK